MQGNRNLFVFIVGFSVLLVLIFFFESRRLTTDDLNATVDARVEAILATQRPLVLTDVALAYPSETPTATATSTLTYTPTATWTPTATATVTPTYTPTATVSITPIAQNIASTQFLVQTLDFVSPYFALSPNSLELVGLDAAQQILHVNLSDNTIQSVGRVSDWITSIAWSPNGRYLAVADIQKNITLHNLIDQEQQSIGSPDLLVEQLVWSPNSTYLAGASSEIVYVWAMFRLNAPFIQRLLHPASRTTVSWQAQDDFFGATVNDGVQISRVIRRAFDLTSILPNTTSAILVEWSPTGTSFATATTDNQIRIHRNALGTVLLTMTGHEAIIHDISWSPDARYIASASGDTTVKVWDVQTGEVLFVLEHPASVMQVAWTFDGRYLITGANEIFVWEFPLNIGNE
jgi:WD40 repeat protein